MWYLINFQKERKKKGETRHERRKNVYAPQQRTKTNRNKNWSLRQLPNILEELELGAPIPKGQRGFSYAVGIEEGGREEKWRLAQRVSTETTTVATDHNASRQSGVGRSTNTSVLFGKWPLCIPIFSCPFFTYSIAPYTTLHTVYTADDDTASSSTTRHLSTSNGSLIYAGYNL